MTLGPHTIVVVKAGLKQSDYGTQQVHDWSTPQMTDVGGCSVQPAAAPEYTTDRDSTSTALVAWVPIDADVTAADRVMFDGETYDVDGDVQRWEFGALSHLVLNLRRSRDEVV
jgi:hypothetical protein